MSQYLASSPAAEQAYLSANAAGIGAYLVANPSALSAYLASDPAASAAYQAGGEAGLQAYLAETPVALQQYIAAQTAAGQTTILQQYLASTPTGLEQYLSSSATVAQQYIATNPTALQQFLTSSPTVLQQYVSTPAGQAPEQLDTENPTAWSSYSPATRSSGADPRRNPELLQQFLASLSDRPRSSSFDVSLNQFEFVVTLPGSGNEATGGLLSTFNIGSGLFTESITPAQLSLLSQASPAGPRPGRLRRERHHGRRRQHPGRRPAGELHGRGGREQQLRHRGSEPAGPAVRDGDPRGRRGDGWRRSPAAGRTTRSTSSAGPRRIPSATSC